MKDLRSLMPVVFLVVVATALSWSPPATAVEPLFGGGSILELSIHAPFTQMDRSSAGQGCVAGRIELEDLFNDEGLPDNKARKRTWKYIESFYDTINNPRKLETKILCACR